MARRNKEQDILDRLLDSLSIRGILLHPATLLVLTTCMVMAVAIFLWEREHDTIASRAEFRLTSENIRVTPPPGWAKDDLKALVLNESSESNVPSILDAQLVPKTAEAMRKVGYVERINRIKKSKSGLDIELEYRQPVANVLLNERTMREWPAANRGKQVLLPVDRFGVVMPEALNAESYLPWIAILYPQDFGNLTTWADWPDQRIQDAASISGQFSKTGRAMGIGLIMTNRDPSQPAQAEIPFELWPSSPKQVGTVIVWGNAPGKEVEGEVSAANKIKVLDAFVLQYGPLNNQHPRRKIDIRTGTPELVSPAKTASKLDDIISDLK